MRILGKILWGSSSTDLASDSIFAIDSGEGFCFI